MSKRKKRVKEEKKARNRKKTAPKPPYAAQCNSFGEWRHVRYFRTLEAVDNELKVIKSANEPDIPPIRVIDIKQRKVIRSFGGTRVIDKPEMDLDSVKEK